MKNTAMASKVANAPKCSVGPKAANNAAAKKAARRPNSRPAVAHNAAVAPSMKASDRIRAPASPPTLSASAPTGGYRTGAPEKYAGNCGSGVPCSR